MQNLTEESFEFTLLEDNTYEVKLKKIDKKNLTSIVEITIHDGVNHEVKRIMESIGHNVIKLKRESFAFLNLGTLKSGEKRNLTSKEVKQLYNAAVNK